MSESKECLLPGCSNRIPRKGLSANRYEQRKYCSTRCRCIASRRGNKPRQKKPTPKPLKLDPGDILMTQWGTIT